MPANASPLKQTISDAMKTAMRAGDKPKLATVRLILAAVKQIEVDDRRDLSDEDLLVVLDKMAKQRRESIAQYEQAGRNDLVEQEQSELVVIQEFLPEQLSESEIQTLIQDAITQTGATGMADMGKIMGLLKPKLQGRADMAAVSKQIKSQLG